MDTQFGCYPFGTCNGNLGGIPPVPTPFSTWEPFSDWKELSPWPPFQSKPAEALQPLFTSDSFSRRFSFLLQPVNFPPKPRFPDAPTTLLGVYL